MTRFIRLIAFVLLLPLAVQAADIAFPPLTGRVVDQAGLLSPGVEAQLDADLAAHERATSQQVVVATVSSLQDQEIADYGVQLGRAWGIGQKDKSTGVILLVAPSERQVRIEVGYGLEGTLTDALSSTIIQSQILPAFREGQVEQGIVRGVRTMLGVLRGDPDAMPRRRSQRDTGEGTPIGLIIFIVVMILIFRRRRRGFFPIVLGGPTMFGGGRRGGFGGGGFRGGGGSFGGGGASGRW